MYTWPVRLICYPKCASPRLAEVCFHATLTIVSMCYQEFTVTYFSCGGIRPERYATVATKPCRAVMRWRDRRDTWNAIHQIDQIPFPEPEPCGFWVQYHASLYTERECVTEEPCVKRNTEPGHLPLRMRRGRDSDSD